MSRKTIPVLVHEECMGSISAGLAKQEANIAKIAENTTTANDKLDTIEGNATAIKTSSANTATQLGTIKTDTSSISSSVGLPADAASENTVIGLLKSIANKLS